LRKEGKWRGKPGYPKFKTRRKGVGSFRLTGKIHVYENAIDLPRLGRLRLKECGYLPAHGVHVLSVTVSEEAGRYYVSLQVEEEVPDPPHAMGTPLGVDLGIKAMAMGSDGTVIENPKALRTELKRLHRRLSRKEKGSKNRDKARKRLARKYARIAHVRRNAHHQATSRLTRAHFSPEERAARRAQIASTLPEPKAKVKPRKSKRSLATQTLEAPPLSEMVAKKVKKQQIKRRLGQATEADAALRPRVVVLEDLHVEGMKRNRKLALAISDVGLGSSDGKCATRPCVKGKTSCLQTASTPRPKNAPTRRVATSRRRWTSLSASMCAKNRSAASSSTEI
jgi:transposase